MLVFASMTGWRFLDLDHKAESLFCGLMLLPVELFYKVILRRFIVNVSNVYVAEFVG